jgi:hypothetical protein
MSAFPYSVDGNIERERLKRNALGNQQPSRPGMGGRFND